MDTFDIGRCQCWKKPIGWMYLWIFYPLFLYIFRLHANVISAQLNSPRSCVFYRTHFLLTLFPMLLGVGKFLQRLISMANNTLLFIHLLFQLHPIFFSHSIFFFRFPKRNAHGLHIAIFPSHSLVLLWICYRKTANQLEMNAGADESKVKKNQDKIISNLKSTCGSSSVIFRIIEIQLKWISKYVRFYLFLSTEKKKWFLNQHIWQRREKMSRARLAHFLTVKFSSAFEAFE